MTGAPCVMERCDRVRAPGDAAALCRHHRALADQFAEGYGDAVIQVEMDAGGYPIGILSAAAREYRNHLNATES